jgi:hypothetical protein
MPKGGKLAAKVCTVHSNFFPAHQKQSFKLQKIAFLLQKKKILAHFLGGMLLS